MRAAVKTLAHLLAVGTSWFVVGAFPGSAHATEGPELSWTAPAECADADALRQGVEHVLERPWASLEAELVIDARVERVEERWQLELSVSRGGSPLPPRVVEGESCAALVEAGAAIVALLIERELVPAEVSEPSVESPPVGSFPEPSTPEPSPSEPEPPTPSPTPERAAESPPAPSLPRPRVAAGQPTPATVFRSPSTNGRP